jgi:hypothetical protein
VRRDHRGAHLRQHGGLVVLQPDTVDRRVRRVFQHLDAFVLGQRDDLVVGQVGVMLGRGISSLVPPDFDDGGRGDERGLHPIHADAEARVVAHQDVVDVVGRLRGVRFVGLFDRLERDHLVRPEERADQRRHDSLDGLHHVAGHDLRPARAFIAVSLAFKAREVVRPLRRQRVGVVSEGASDVVRQQCLEAVLVHRLSHARPSTARDRRSCRHRRVDGQGRLARSASISALYRASAMSSACRRRGM